MNSMKMNAIDSTRSGRKSIRDDDYDDLQQVNNSGRFRMQPFLVPLTDSLEIRLRKKG